MHRVGRATEVCLAAVLRETDTGDPKGSSSVKIPTLRAIVVRVLPDPENIDATNLPMCDI